MARFGEHFLCRRGSHTNRTTPELHRTFESDAIGCRDEDTIRNGMGTLDGDPRFMRCFLPNSFFCFFDANPMAVG